MSVETHRVLIGASGWKHQTWLQDFYDEDLPEDWQLSFYANEFPLVYVPISHWLNNEELGQWCEDTAESFRFILEIPNDIVNNEDAFLSAMQKAKLLKGGCLGFVFQINNQNAITPSLLQLHINEAKKIAPICIEKDENLLSDDIKQILVNENISAVWDGKSNYNAENKRGSLSIAMIKSENLDMANLRTIIEHCLTASNEHNTSALCFSGEPPSLALLRNANIILNLL